MFDKITVVGAQKHPLYEALIEARPKAVSVAEVPFSEKLKGYGIAPKPGAGSAVEFREVSYQPFRPGRRAVRA